MRTGRHSISFSKGQVNNLYSFFCGGGGYSCRGLALLRNPQRRLDVGPHSMVEVSKIPSRRRKKSRKVLKSRY